MAGAAGALPGGRAGARRDRAGAARTRLPGISPAGRGLPGHRGAGKGRIKVGRTLNFLQRANSISIQAPTLHANGDIGREDRARV
ncbi:hypothetical protein YQ44_07900 [Janthinobacterium sp. 1_2014MBL_MicDiv]|nr:hypothetical protein YQ44_07900 [Janthinobacterium sp. 1_2014MBL_MicDiv]